MKRFYTIILFALMLSQSAFTQSETVEKPSTDKVKIFPNPATNVINVLGLKNSYKAVIVVSDSYGNKIIQHQWAIKNNALNIPIAKLNSGIYTISIRSQEQQIRTKFYKK